jgi:hypothetical protein
VRRARQFEFLIPDMPIRTCAATGRVVTLCHVDIGSHSRLFRQFRGTWPIALCAVGVLALGQWTDVLGVLGERAIERDALEQEVTSALIFQGVSASDVSCPGDLRKKSGARMTCTYVDSLSDIVDTVILGDQNPPPRTGRVEVEVRRLERRSFGPRSSDVVSQPELAVRIIDRAR